MPFYVSPEQSMKDKADYARKRITGIRSGLVIACEAGMLFVAPNASRALRKFSEIYDRIAFAAVGRYNEFENLRKAGVRYADMTGFQYDRQDVTARGLANWYAQMLGTIFTDSPKPFEVEIVVAEVAEAPAEDQIYRITFDGSVNDEHGYVAVGGRAERIGAVLKEHYADGLSLPQALTTAIAGLAAPTNGDRVEIVASQLEVAVLDRTREHRTFRRLTGSRLESLLSEAAQSANASAAPTSDQGAAGGETGVPAKPKKASNGQRPTEPDPGGGDADGGSPS